MAPAPTAPPGPPLLFLIVTFAVATAVAILVAYLGITGAIGAGIP